jgi:hypothetical protein
LTCRAFGNFVSLSLGLFFKSWNDTVANLTLMALGSSSPEILLSVIEICGNGFMSGELGPGTIVGQKILLFSQRWNIFFLNYFSNLRLCSI